MNIFEATVRSCLHLVKHETPDLTKPTIASGVIVRYKGRFFICTVEHFAGRHRGSVGILTGRTKEGQTEIYELGEFSYMEHMQWEHTPDAEDLLKTLEHPNRGAELDIAFKEIGKLHNILQAERTFDLHEIGKVTVAAGEKAFLIVDKDLDIDRNDKYCFYGRIRPKFENGVVDFEEKLYWGLIIKSITEHFI